MIVLFCLCYKQLPVTYLTLRYDIAKELNLDPVRDAKELDKFLSTVDEDGDWSKDDPKERGYLAMGLKRYKVNWSDTLVRTQDIDVMQESIVNQTNSSASSSMQSLGMGAAVIKIEYEAWQNLQNNIKKAMDFQERGLNKAIGECKKLVASLAALVQSSPDLKVTCHCLRVVQTCGFCFVWFNFWL